MSVSENRFQLRVLSGPLSGSIYPIEEQLEIGRTAASNIQLVGRGVSRQHAVIMATDEGGHVLVDMLSTNGTWAGGERVDRVRLHEGVQFAIDDTEFVYERAAIGVPGTPPATTFVAPSAASRDTAEFGGPRVALHPTGAAAETMQAPVVGSGSQTGSGPQFCYPDKTPYPRNLLADIVVFRNLRLKMVRAGGGLSQPIVQQFRRLDQFLRAGTDTGDERREFVRFACQLPGTMRLEKDDRRLDAVVRDIAVDGARVRVPGIVAQLNSLVWLSLPLIGESGLRCIVFTARIAWMESDELGLVFAGAPTWATRSKEREQEQTQPMDMARVKLKKTAIE